MCHGSTQTQALGADHSKVNRCRTIERQHEPPEILLEHGADGCGQALLRLADGSIDTP